MLHNQSYKALERIGGLNFSYFVAGILIGGTVLVVAETTVMEVDGDLSVSDRVAAGKDFDGEMVIALDGEAPAVGIRGTAIGDSGSSTDSSYGFWGVANDAQGIGGQGNGGFAGLGGVGDVAGLWADGDTYGIVAIGGYAPIYTKKVGAAPAAAAMLSSAPVLISATNVEPRGVSGCVVKLDTPLILVQPLVCHF